MLLMEQKGSNEQLWCRAKNANVNSSSEAVSREVDVYRVSVAWEQLSAW